VPDTTKKPFDRRDLRQARLEQALRENLKKRKALARRRSATGAADGEKSHSGSSKALTDD